MKITELYELIRNIIGIIDHSNTKNNNRYKAICENQVNIQNNIKDIANNVSVIIDRVNEINQLQLKHLEAIESLNKPKANSRKQKQKQYNTK